MEHERGKKERKKDICCLELVSSNQRAKLDSSERLSAPGINFSSRFFDVPVPKQISREKRQCAEALSKDAVGRARYF